MDPSWAGRSFGGDTLRQTGRTSTRRPQVLLEKMVRPSLGHWVNSVVGDLSHWLWRLSSPLLGREVLAAEKPTISDQSRGFVVNSRCNLLMETLKRAVAR